MTTRRQFIAKTAAVAVTASVLRPAATDEAAGTARDEVARAPTRDDVDGSIRGPVTEVVRYNTLVARAQSVPFPG